MHIRRSKTKVYIIRDEFCMVHELTRIKTGSEYISLTGKFTPNKHEAMLVHPEHASHIILQLELKYKGLLFITESNRINR